MEELFKQILDEQKKQSKMLQIIVSNQEQKAKIEYEAAKSISIENDRDLEKLNRKI